MGAKWNKLLFSNLELKIINFGTPLFPRSFHGVTLFTYLTNQFNSLVDSPPRRSRDTGATSGTAQKALLEEENGKEEKAHCLLLVILSVCKIFLINLLWWPSLISSGGVGGLSRYIATKEIWRSCTASLHHFWNIRYKDT